MHTINADTSGANDSKAYIRRLATYTAGVLLCLKGYSTPVFATIKNTNTATIDMMLLQNHPTHKDSTLYTDFMTEKDKQALRLPNDEAIKALKELIEKDAHTAMALSYLQSRRYLRLGNRYSNVPAYAAATQTYLKGTEILRKIQEKLDPTQAQEHTYKLNIQLAKMYSYQVGKDIYESGIDNAQDAILAAATLLQWYPNNAEYTDKYRTAIMRKAVLSAKAGQTGAAYILYTDLETHYEAYKDFNNLAIVYKNKAAILYEDTLAMQHETAKRAEFFNLMDKADNNFKQYFQQSNTPRDVNYKLFILQYIEYLVHDEVVARDEKEYTLQLDKAKELYHIQSTIATSNDDVKSREEEVKLIIDRMEAGTPLEKIKVSKKEKIHEAKQESINQSKDVMDYKFKYDVVENKLRESEARAAAAEAREKTTKAEADKKAAEAETRTTKAENIALEEKATAAKEREEKERAEKELAKEKTRTEEIKNKNMRIALAGIASLLMLALGGGWKIFKKNKQIKQQNEELESKKIIIEKQHKGLTDAVRSAAKGQRKNLANARGVMKEHLPDHFIFHSPHEPELEVSGDFYRASHDKKSKKTYLLTADCTGHGPEGATTSVAMGIMVDNVINRYEIKDPGEVLTYTREEVKKYNTSHYTDASTSAINDGMDASLCLYDEKLQTLEFAGGNHSVYVLRTVQDTNNATEISEKPKTIEYSDDQKYVLLEYAGDRQPISGGWKESDFVTKTIQLQPGDVIYTSSDGYADQGGGPKEKKFMTKNMKKLLLSLGGKPLKEQQQIVEETFWNRKGDYPQRDDVLVIGVQIPEKEEL